MPRFRSIFTILVAACLLGAGARGASAVEDFAFFHENVMGTSMELRVSAGNAEAAARAEARALREIDRLSAIFSGYDPESELGRWLRAGTIPVAVSAELFEVLSASDRWREASGGAFDPRVGALVRLWAARAREDRAPTVEEIAAARARMDRPAWRLEPSARTVERLSDCPLTLDAIAKGYIVGRAGDAAIDGGDGVRGVLLNVGGDIRVRGAVARAIGIIDPERDWESGERLTTIVVRDRSVSTSGRSQRGYRIKGRWYSHKFDPRTGRPVERVASATVVAANAADADALATTLNVLSAEEGLAVVTATPGADCLIVDRDGRITRSAGWNRLETASRPVVALAAADPAAAAAAPVGKDPKPGAAGASWGEEFELAVDFEINRPEAEPGRYRRPYVAIWVENTDGFPVRTLTLWVSLGGSGPFQWLPDLKRWHLSDQLRKRSDKTDMVVTIARPTRPPGKYTVVWDGKDDHGKPLPRGEYTVHIDAAREHGTYQGLRAAVTLADTPFYEPLKGNVEIKAATIQYRRKAAPK